MCTFQPNFGGYAKKGSSAVAEPGSRVAGRDLDGDGRVRDQLVDGTMDMPAAQARARTRALSATRRQPWKKRGGGRRPVAMLVIVILHSASAALLLPGLAG